MKSIFAVLCAAITINATAWMIPARADAEVFTANGEIPGLNQDLSGLDFEDSLSTDVLDWGAVGATGNLAWAVFEPTTSHYHNSMTSKETQPAAVPEPASMFLVGTGLLAIAGIGRKKLQDKKDQMDLSRGTAGFEAGGYEA